MSPDTVSSMYPDRPIRPLPKRRLREKLSPELAHTIQYPRSTPDAPLFHYPPYSSRDDAGVAAPESPNSVTAYEFNETSRNYYTPRAHIYAASASAELPDEISLTSVGIEGKGRSGQQGTQSLRNASAQAPPSAASSIDGYDSFENTNNKKKRKIPSAAETGVNGNHGLTSEAGSLSISTRSVSPGVNSDKSHPPYGYGVPGAYASASPGMSGPGRGRLGRSLNGRSPLRTLADGGNLWSSRGSKTVQAPWSPDQEGAGIITNAIANAGKHPPQGQENVSLLQQYSANNKAAPVSTQFTFTCDSQVPGTVQWPERPGKQLSTSHTNSAAQAENIPGHAPHDAPLQHSRGANGGSRRRERRRLERELDLAARHRRQIAAETYYHSPPKLEDIWICEFCEYERIFGEPPRALIRDYELKDRRLRQEVAERKRLVEKAKAKARKNKKNAKASKANQSPSQAQEVHHDDQGPVEPDIQALEGHSTQSEEDYEDDIEEEYLRAPPLPPPLSRSDPGPGDLNNGREASSPWPGPGA